MREPIHTPCVASVSQQWQDCLLWHTRFLFHEIDSGVLRYRRMIDMHQFASTSVSLFHPCLSLDRAIYECSWHDLSQKSSKGLSGQLTWLCSRARHSVLLVESVTDYLMILAVCGCMLKLSHCLWLRLFELRVASFTTLSKCFKPFNNKWMSVMILFHALF